MTTRPPAPVVIEGRYIRLEPLTLDHVQDLYAAGGWDDGVWAWLPVVTPRSEYEMRAIVEQRLAQQAAGDVVMFTAVYRPTSRPVGWIAYLDVSVADARLDIGWYWLTRGLWSTAAEVETHLLLLHNAFETLRFGRVQWQIDDLDGAARDTMLALGAIREGLFRRHIRRSDGSWRDTVMYSLLGSEWPAARERALAGWILR